MSTWAKCLTVEFNLYAVTINLYICIFLRKYLCKRFLNIGSRIATFSQVWKVEETAEGQDRNCDENI